MLEAFNIKETKTQQDQNLYKFLYLLELLSYKNTNFYDNFDKDTLDENMSHFRDFYAPIQFAKYADRP